MRSHGRLFRTVCLCTRPRGHVHWADLEDEGDFEGGETYVELGGSIEVVEDWREEQQWESKQGEWQAAQQEQGGTRSTRAAELWEDQGATSTRCLQTVRHQTRWWWYDLGMKHDTDHGT